MRQIYFTVPGFAVPWARAGRRGGFSYTPRKQADFMCAVKTIAAARMQGAAPMTGPVAMEIEAVYPWPKRTSAKARARTGANYKATRPDLSNLIKIVEDSLNGVVYRDDGQIAASEARKCFGDAACLSVAVRALAGSEQDMREAAE